VRTAYEYLEPSVRMPQQQVRKPNLCSSIFLVTFPRTKMSFNLISICLNVVQRCSQLCNVYMFRSITQVPVSLQAFSSRRNAAVTANAWLINIDWRKPMNQLQANENSIKQDINDVSNICNASIPSLCIWALQRACRHVLLANTSSICSLSPFLH
jgi:hypothetical protein